MANFTQAGTPLYVVVFGKRFQYEVRPLETLFTLPGGARQSIPNWDVKGVRERYYKEEFSTPSVEDLEAVAKIGQYGLSEGDIIRFIKQAFREELAD